MAELSRISKKAEEYIEGILHLLRVILLLVVLLKFLVMSMCVILLSSLWV